MDAVEGDKSMYTACAEDLNDQTLTFCFGKAIGSDLGTTVATFYANIRVVNNVFVIRSPSVYRRGSILLLPVYRIISQTAERPPPVKSISEVRGSIVRQARKN